MASPPGENSYYPGSNNAKSFSSNSNSVPTTSKPISVRQQTQPNLQQNQNQNRNQNPQQQQNPIQQQQRAEQQQQQFTSGSEYALAFQRNGVINEASLDVWGRVRENSCIFSIRLWVGNLFAV